MNRSAAKPLKFIAIFSGVFLILRYMLPLFMPFLLGFALALAAEPLVRFLAGSLRLPRTAAAGIGVSLSFSFLTLVILLLCAAAVRELRHLAGILPQLEGTARTAMDSLSGWMLRLADKAPDGLRSVLTGSIGNFFSEGSALLEKVTAWLLRLASGMLGKLPDRALSIGTGIISSFMISAKLPRLKAAALARIPGERLRRLRKLLARLRSTVGGWLKAQLKLCGVNFLVIAAGFFLLRVRFAPFLALLTAIVDAFPILGTGAVLIPWSLAAFAQGQRFRAFGLLGIYAAAAVTRSVLEPRLVGNQLGLDPLVTLMALYAGYRLWGLPGMLLAPILAAAAAQLAAPAAGD